MFGDGERWKAIGTDNTRLFFETEIRLVDQCWTILYADGRTVLFIDPTFPSVFPFQLVSFKQAFPPFPQRQNSESCFDVLV